MRMATSLLGFGLLLQAGTALAQNNPVPNNPQVQPPDKTQQFKATYEDLVGLKGVREVPGLEKLTRLESEAEMMERMKQEALRIGERLAFPEEPVLSKEMYPGRHWTPKAMEIEPCYVAHGRLLFEQQNFERRPLGSRSRSRRWCRWPPSTSTWQPCPITWARGRASNTTRAPASACRATRRRCCYIRRS